MAASEAVSRILLTGLFLFTLARRASGRVVIGTLVRRQLPILLALASSGRFGGWTQVVG